MHPVFRFPLRRTVCVALLLMQLAGCMTWHVVPGTPEQQTGAQRISHARLRLRDGSEIQLHDVTVSADSVIGFPGAGRERRAVPVADVASIERRQLSAARTAALVVGTATVATLVLVGAAWASVAKECC